MKPYRLLDSFTIVPGTDGENIEASTLSKWILEVRTLGVTEGREKHVDYYIGHTLAYSVPDPIDKAWPHRVVRDAIESLSNYDAERGIVIARFNLRGMTSRAMFEGGKQERELAQTYRDWAKAALRWPRTSDLLTRIAEDWDRDAERVDSDAKLEQMRR